MEHRPTAVATFDSSRLPSRTECMAELEASVALSFRVVAAGHGASLAVIDRFFTPEAASGGQASRLPGPLYQLIRVMRMFGDPERLDAFLEERQNQAIDNTRGFGQPDQAVDPQGQAAQTRSVLPWDPIVCPDENVDESLDVFVNQAGDAPFDSQDQAVEPETPLVDPYYASSAISSSDADTLVDPDDSVADPQNLNQVTWPQDRQDQAVEPETPLVDPYYASSAISSSDADADALVDPDDSVADPQNLNQVTWPQDRQDEDDSFYYELFRPDPPNQYAGPSYQPRGYQYLGFYPQYPLQQVAHHSDSSDSGSTDPQSPDIEPSDEVLLPQFFKHMQALPPKDGSVWDAHSKFVQVVKSCENAKTILTRNNAPDQSEPTIQQRCVSEVIVPAMTALNSMSAVKFIAALDNERSTNSSLIWSVSLNYETLVYVEIKRNMSMAWERFLDDNEKKQGSALEEQALPKETTTMQKILASQRGSPVYSVITDSFLLASMAWTRQSSDPTKWASSEVHVSQCGRSMNPLDCDNRRSADADSDYRTPRAMFAFVCWAAWQGYRERGT
ncbi:hypothetical protein SCP_0600450 [Sparassis crispa]|uniref:Uncharacterized protein n=1 Tax=Sparassis crispa TaxID=139825 RepID=A0A401GPB8_9APHY|nr:hypothetical protein SCP_0600450 [Sparassis crispa]GBE84067.1 hypothetical protein SCP_0600450 [Sparassis crispa]